MVYPAYTNGYLGWLDGWLNGERRRPKAAKSAKTAGPKAA